MTRALLSAALAASLALGGCASQLKAADVGNLLDKAHAAGCGGSVTVDVRGGTGQLGGSASGQFTANLDCPKGIAVEPPAANSPPTVVNRQ